MPKLIRFGGNPIIAPEQGQSWEERGTFNPAAVNSDGGIHLLYRAVDAHQISRIGYARISNGTEVSIRSSNPVLEPTAEWEEFGCEDPRITPIDGTFFVTYTAYSRRGPRIALAETKDFMHFHKYGLIGPDLNDKDCVLFPERVNGRVAMLHRIQSEVQIAYFNSFEALRESREYWNGYLRHYRDYEVIKPLFSWERRKVGSGPPPIKTERGWLLIYHGVSIDRIYRAGAILLDLDDPSRVLARTRQPILEPDMEFEKHGIVPNVIFPDGAVIRGGELFMYYGGADRVCCVASAPLDEFLDELEAQSLPT